MSIGTNKVISEISEAFADTQYRSCSLLHSVYTTNSELLHLPCTQVRKNPRDFTQHFFWRVFLQQIQEWIHYASLQQFCPLGVVTSCQVRQRKRRIFNTSSVGRLEMSRQCSDWLPALGTKTTHKLIDHISM